MLDKFKEEFGDKLPRILYLIYCDTYLSEICICTIDQFDDLYTGFISGVIGNLGTGKTPERIDELSPMSAIKNNDELTERCNMFANELSQHVNYSFEQFLIDYPEDKWFKIIELHQENWSIERLMDVRKHLGTKFKPRND